MADSGKVVSDPLFVGLTRPPMLLGVTYPFVVVNALFSYVMFILTAKPMYILVFAPLIHAIGFYICSKEPLFLDLIRVKSNKCSRCTNKHYHGANSYDPF